MKNLVSPKIAFLAGAVFISAVSRLIPHAPNWTPLLGLALFAGTRSKSAGILVPLAAMLVSDLFLGFHATVVAVYGTLAAISFLPRWMDIRKPFVGGSIFGVKAVVLSGAASLLFFVTTNFAVWLGSEIYTPTLAGLWNCYVMALPFLTGTAVSTVLSFQFFSLTEKILLPVQASKQSIQQALLT